MIERATQNCQYLKEVIDKYLLHQTPSVPSGDGSDVRGVSDHASVKA